MARLLQSHIMRLDFHFHLKCEHLRIAHLAYADNLLLSRGDIPSITTLSTCLKQFREMEGLHNDTSGQKQNVVIWDPQKVQVEIKE